MKKKNCTLAIMVAVLAGCGGGGSDEPTDVSANPPAPVAAAPTPGTAPVPPPVVAPPPKTPTPAPPSSPPAAAPPPAGNPPAGPPSISGNVLALAIGQRFIPVETLLAIGKIQDIANAPNSDATHTQEHHFPLPQQTEGRYLSRSMGWQNPNTGFTNPVSVALSLSWSPFGQGAAYGTELGQEMSINGATLYRSAAFRVEPGDVVALDQTVAQWVSAPWIAKLIVQSGDDPAQFRLCWNTNTEQALRHACGKFDRATGAHRGVYIIDDNIPRNVRITWENE